MSTRLFSAVYRILQARGLSAPDGRPLYQYRLTAAELAELRQAGQGLNAQDPLNFIKLGQPRHPNCVVLPLETTYSGQPSRKMRCDSPELIVVYVEITEQGAHAF
ncbi:hypothetical protein KKB55_13720 [Myxococcota bacterium]|nr:hypothetical protein [Myxococcota bacterium]MBU1898793.1 hypothetical protein [Myxococcota bacterium]